MQSRLEELTEVLIKRIRERVRSRQPYEEARDAELQSVDVSKAGLSREESFDLRKNVEDAYRAQTMEEARSSPRSGKAKITKGRIRPTRIDTGMAQLPKGDRDDYDPPGAA